MNSRSWDKDECLFWLNHEYPCVIFRDRYGGSWSGGKWIALIEDQVPDFVGDDVTLSQWAHYEETDYVGRGESIVDAMTNLGLQVSRYKGVSADAS